MTATLERDYTEQRKTFKELEKENAKLKRMLVQKEREHLEELDKIETELTDEIVKLQDRLILAKSLINIPDNLEDCVRELIRERLKGWVNIAYEASGLAWLDSEETPCARFDLEKALNRPKGKGQKSAR